MRVKLYGFWCLCLICMIVVVIGTIDFVRGAMSGEWNNVQFVLLALDWVSLPLCFWYAWRRMAIGWAYVLAREDFYERAGRIYLWGYPLAEIIQQELPRRLGKYYGSGFCHEFAAVTMYALKGVRTVRLCHGIDPEYGRHSWVEYRKYGVWWVADPAWVYQECVPWPRSVCRKTFDLKLESACGHQEFWQGPFAKAINVLADPGHELQDSLMIDFFPVFWPVYGYGMKKPDEDGGLRPIIEHKAVKPTKPASATVKANLKDRGFIARFMNDSSFYALEDADDTTA